MTAPQLLILADDLTGAADTGAFFPRCGRRTLVRFAPGPTLGAEVLALCTHSRHLDAAAAAQAQVRALSEGGVWAPGTAVYKKIDSTLRGQPAAELAAVLAALDRRRVLVAPAFPAQRRTIIGGRLYVAGVPVDEGAEGEGSLGAVFAGVGLTLQPLPLPALRAPGLPAMLQEEGCWLADSDSDEDLWRLAQASLAAGIDLWCGSAGLARALGAARWPGVEEELDLPAPRPRPVLVVVGSRHPKSAEQVGVLVQAGAVLGGPNQREGALRAALGAGGIAVLSAAGLPEGEPDEVAGLLAAAAHRLANSTEIGGMVLTGGDTARAVAAELGSSAIWLRGEVEPGLPWGLLADGLHAGLRVATKAGGFGGPEALALAAGRVGGGRRWS